MVRKKKRRKKKPPGEHWTGCDYNFNCHAQSREISSMPYTQSNAKPWLTSPTIINRSSKKIGALNTVIKAELAMLSGCLLQNIWVIAGIDAKSWTIAALSSNDDVFSFELIRNRLIGANTSRVKGIRVMGCSGLKTLVQLQMMRTITPPKHH